MAILHAIGEDLDFPTLATATVVTTAGRFRSGYARCAIQPTLSTAAVKSSVFPGGGVTSCWIAAQVFHNSITTARMVLGLGKLGTDAALYVATSSSSTTKLALYKSNGTTDTSLATESGSSFGASALHRIDMHVTSHGATASVDVYLNASLVITGTFDTTVTGLSDFDSVFLRAPASNVSEIIVADEDTRSFSLATLAPNGVGAVNAWTGTWADVDETTTNDADLLTTNTVALDSTLTLTDPPSGSFSVKAVRISARAQKASGATAGSVALGVVTNGSTDAGGDQALTTAWAAYERVMATNPVTSAAWSLTELTPLQINLRSAT